MKCRSPVLIGVNLYVPCGQCQPCRIRQRKLWTSRIELEASHHREVSFITLTYAEGKNDGNLHPVHLKNWLKRIREKVEPLRLRYFAVGEYGSTTQRPHYHVVLFGYRSCQRGRTEHRFGVCCASCDLVSQTWGFGGIDQGSFGPGVARYVSGYVTKKMTHRNDARLEGRTPEFARMSLKPGIGAFASGAIADTVRNHPMLMSAPDVPAYLKSQGQTLLLGSYLRRLIREELGREGRTPDEVLRKWSSRMLALQLYAREVDRSPKEILREMGEAGARSDAWWEEIARRKQHL